MPTDAAVLAATQTDASSFLLPAVMLLLVVGLFVMNSRNRKRMAAKQEDMRNSLRPGSKVQMISGLKGTVRWAEDGDIGIEISEGVVATFNARAVAEVLDKPTTPAEPVVPEETVVSPVQETKRDSAD